MTNASRALALQARAEPAVAGKQAWKAPVRGDPHHSELALFGGESRNAVCAAVGGRGAGVIAGAAAGFGGTDGACFWMGRKNVFL